MLIDCNHDRDIENPKNIVGFVKDYICACVFEQTQKEKRKAANLKKNNPSQYYSDLEAARLWAENS